MTTRICVYCQAQLDPGAKFCNDCGKPVATVRVESTSPAVCPACGKSHAPAARFCNACGFPLPGVGPASPSSTVSSPVLSTLRPVEEPAPRKKLSWPVWAGIVAASLCLCGAVVAVAFFVVRPLIDPTQSVAVADETGQPPASTPTPYAAVATSTHNEPTTTEPVDTPTPTITEEPSPTPTPTPTPRPKGRPFVGELAPEFTLTDASTGEDVTLSHFTGRPVVVTFWATWCTYCEDEMPFFQSAFEQWQTEGLVILAINFEEGRSDVLAYGEDHDLTFPLLLDEDGDVTERDYDVSGFPTSFFIYPDGTIAYIQIGSMTQAQLNEQLVEIMSP